MTVEERIAELEEKEKAFRSQGLTYRADQYKNIIEQLKERLHLS